jgi:hypothetical protein
MANVTINGGIFCFAIRNPLKSPQAKLAPIAARTHNMNGFPSRYSTANKQLESAITDPTERSIPPLIITSAMAITTIQLIAKLTPTDRRLLVDENESVKIHKKAAIAIMIIIKFNSLKFRIELNNLF